MEPPSPILDNLKFSADQTSDDPLSQNIYMIVGESSGDGREGFSVCAWSAHAGLSYIGTPGSLVS